MFSKTDKSTGAARTEFAAAEPAGRRPIAASLIAENVTINGDLASDGDVQLDGTLVGDLRVGRLTIGETGRVEGAVEAETVDIRGRVTGSITAKAVRLYATADVEGDITHAQLAIDAGASFQGRSLKFQAPVEVTALIEAAE
ncbi:bactofilin family protein [Phenylobacterium deserti]|uniref:Cell shape determination protein CcmA n=1 Tax=Phenylobacterium deserti TaxID=1914756 RepID=A0A328A8L9_9CAUL|nr:polymer-forming cytoskeletal protein [Phenylobacterium deserti]RAK50900.1 cell shape determination protein CcmA [Phenylobacterium deserti]